MKNQDKLLEEEKLAGYTHLSGSQFREAEGYLKLRSYLHNSIVNCAPRILKYMNRHELYIECSPKRMKDKNMNEIESSSCVNVL